MTMENEEEDAEGTGDRFDDEDGIIGKLIKFLHDHKEENQILFLIIK